MRKDLSGLIGTLEKSAIEIAASGADNRDELMHQSMTEFEAALLAQLEPVLPAESEPLQKGLNHIALFANVLRDASRSIEAMKTGKPSWMTNDNGGTPDYLPPEIAADMDRFIQVGIATLRSMVNDTAELPEDDADLERAEQAGELVKIDSFDGADLLVKTALPAEYHLYLTDPVDLITDYALLGRGMLNSAIALAEPMVKQNVLPVGLAEDFPELFKAVDEEDDEETVGDGGDPNAVAAANDNPANSMGPANDNGDAELTDDAPQDPIEMIIRLASIIVVVGGSLKQAGANDDQDMDAAEPGDDMAEPADATAEPPPVAAAAAGGAEPFKKKPFPPAAKQAPVFDAPLAKILRGEIAVDETLAAALEELMALRKGVAAHSQTSAELQVLKDTVARLQKTPAEPKGGLFAVSKSQDTELAGQRQDQQLARAEQIEALAKTDPDRAARELMKVVHAGGGVPLLPTG